MVREYGILLTDRVYAEEAGFLPVSEFLKSKAGDTAEPVEGGKRSPPGLRPPMGPGVRPGRLGPGTDTLGPGAGPR